MGRISLARRAGTSADGLLTWVKTRRRRSQDEGDCTVAALSQPENGQLGAECQPFETLAHGASCSLVCNVGYTRAGVQPSCTNSDFDTGSIVCNGDP